jgi:hypothetical protein
MGHFYFGDFANTAVMKILEYTFGWSGICISFVYKPSSRINSIFKSPRLFSHTQKHLIFSEFYFNNILESFQ